jgi:CrcB protein
LISESGDYRRPFLITGFLGGFTTFSALALEVVDLIDQGMWLIILTYLIVTVGAGLTAVKLGVALAQRVVKP